MAAQKPAQVSRRLRTLPQLIFASRWLQLPLYLGLILAQCVYVFHFWVELVHLIEAAFGNKEALFRKAVERYLQGPAAYLPNACRVILNSNEFVFVD
mgnify:CR=1 FL=1